MSQGGAASEVLRDSFNTSGSGSETEATVAMRGPRSRRPAATSSVEALQRDAFARNRMHARNLCVLLTGGGLCLPLLGGDPTALALVFVALAITIGTYLWILWRTRDLDRYPERYNERHASIVAHLAAATSLPTLYYFGIFSGATALLMTSMFIYLLGARLRHALGVLVILCAGHTLLATLVISGLLADRGLVVADYLTTGEQIILQLLLVALYIFSFVGARSARRGTAKVVDQLETAVRQVSQREALLQEARQELQAALRIGGPGRYSGQRVGDFALGALLGRGGMGEVYEATHTTTGAVVAVKLMPPAALAHPEMIERFIRESRAVANTASPNVVRVIEVAPEDAAFPYLAMERLEGDSLAAILRERGRLSLEECVDLAEQVGAGLEAARHAGVVHRDLKPGNLVHHQCTTWKILDFGVSKLAAHSDTLTHGQTVGTPAFMAPEQARGEPVDHRADQYALAVNIYRAITGQPAFNGDDIPAIMYAVVHTSPPPPSKLVQVPRAVDEVLARALAKTPDQRFETAAHFASALRAAAQWVPSCMNSSSCSSSGS